ncbi:MAG: 50S ribosomal protein L28 [Spirochaetia bacterium]|nr:50S ribosomal protein L28 [Spirochaetia bacterium]
MAKICAICNKRHLSGHLVSHANNKSNTRRNPNLQTVRIMLDGKVQRVWVCTRCLRSGKAKKVASGRTKKTA